MSLPKVSAYYTVALDWHDGQACPHVRNCCFGLIEFAAGCPNFMCVILIFVAAQFRVRSEHADWTPGGADYSHLSCQSPLR